MKGFASHFAESVRAVIVGLLAGSVVTSFALVLYSFVLSTTTYGSIRAIAIAIVVTIGLVLLYGLIPALVYGAPVYALLRKHSFANYVTSAVVGGVPGLVLIPFEPFLGWPSFIAGTTSALVAHSYAERSIRVQ